MKIKLQYKDNNFAQLFWNGKSVASEPTLTVDESRIKGESWVEMRKRTDAQRQKAVRKAKCCIKEIAKRVNNYDLVINSLRGVLENPDIVRQLNYLEKGIGANHPDGKILMEARDLLAQLDTKGEE